MLMMNLDRYTKCLLDLKITPNEFLFIMFLHTKKRKLFDLYMKEKKTKFSITKERLRDLENRDLIIRIDKEYYSGGEFDRYFVDADMATDAIYNIYPKFLVKDNGNNIPLVTMDKNVFKNIYIGKINGDLNEHEEILEDIQYGIDNNLIKMGINKFLVSEFWKSLRSYRLNTGNIDLTEDDSF